MKKIRAFAAAAVLLTAVPASVCADSNIPMDYNSDGAVNIFDMVEARKTVTSAAELKRLSSFILGKGDIQPDDEGYTLLWSDEFDGSDLDMNKWSYELGNWKLDDSGNYITGGWGNNEQEFYTSQNTGVKDGILTISAKKEHWEDEKQGSYEYTSARLSTQHKFSVCGGKIEVRARCDSGKSLWPAIWMLPEDSAYGGWASSGEIDIMEGWGSTPEKICGTIHFGGTWPNNTYLTNNYVFTDGDSTENWHTYSIEWERGEIRWYVDGKLYSTQTDWYSEGFEYPAPFDQNFYIILNLAVGGHFDGIDGVHADPSIFANGSKNFDIDYVRVYKKDGSDLVPSELSSLALDNYIEGAEAAVTNKSGCTSINIRNAGELEYAVMGLLRGREVKAGEKHTIEFDVSSTAERSMAVTVEDSSYTRYLDKKLTITPEKKHYSFDVTFEQDMSADIKFQLGNIDGASALGAHEVQLYNISWK
ncbi:glycoside hydrolase family 16 protein [Ruminococcus sp.]|uniref:glycoside hydrolase family 16 protein n=1 Tax=Ruminococcus sp. TaxID=41978 RepID=UPI0025DA4247|nr:glycoside hydrolase family 16 protein [Ruminococcus sp.]MCR4640190.1 glycoside hydrolase family 16 protein [Ruminococcus sp.]